MADGVWRRPGTDRVGSTLYTVWKVTAVAEARRTPQPQRRGVRWCLAPQEELWEPGMELTSIW